MLKVSQVSIPKRLSSIEVSFELGKLHAVTGPNGSGKSTLLKTVAGLITPKAGSISYKDQSLEKLDRRSRSRLISYIPQSFNMPYPYTVEEMITMGLYAAQGSSIIVDSCLERVEASHFKHIPFIDLSTGEKQRILIARGLATQCPVLLFDEPTANLDLRYQKKIWDLIQTLKDEHTVLVASHDLEQIQHRCDMCLVLDGGRTLAYGASSKALEELKCVYESFS